MFCKYCGKKVEDSAAFCGNCGHKTSEKKITTKGKKKIWIIMGLILLVLIILISCFIIRKNLFRIGNKEESIEMQDNPIVHTYTEEEKQSMIGKYVDYKPQSNTYIAKASMTGITEKFGMKVTDQIFSTEADMRWRIWSIDNDSIMLISNKATTIGGYGGEYLEGNLVLKGNTGYNNGSIVLDELCKTCYSNEKYESIEVRSSNLMDIKETLKRETWDTGLQEAINEIGGENRSTNG